MLFMVKVRLDTARVGELGAKLQAGAIDLGAMRWTFCHQEDLAVGVSLWEVADRGELDRRLDPLRPYYARVDEVTPVITSPEAQARLLEQHPRPGGVRGA